MKISCGGVRIVQRRILFHNLIGVYLIKGVQADSLIRPGFSIVKIFFDLLLSSNSIFGRRRYPFQNAHSN